MTDKPSAERARDDVSPEVIARVQAAADPILSREDWQQIDPPAEQRGFPVEASAEVSREQAERIAEAVKPEFATGDWRKVEREKLANTYEQTRNAIAVAREKMIADLLRSQLASTRREIARLEAEVVKARADEREACAKVADSWPSTTVESNAHPLARDGIAAAIRSRT